MNDQHLKRPSWAHFIVLLRVKNESGKNESCTGAAGKEQHTVHLKVMVMGINQTARQWHTLFGGLSTTYSSAQEFPSSFLLFIKASDFFNITCCVTFCTRLIYIFLRFEGMNERQNVTTKNI
jgi:hypothetical protein